MCGIAGLIQKNPESAVQQAFVRASHQFLTERGPDQQTWQQVGEQMVLIHTRLSIIDPGNARQPMENQDGIIVFNGEIYNYQELRDSNLRYRTNSDTEVLLQGLQTKGIGFLHQSDGMFAFACFDYRTNHLTLARDPLGIKPLYYFFDGETLAFASTIPPLMLFSKKECNEEALLEYYLHRSVRAPRTIFQDIHELPPGHMLTFDLSSFTLGPAQSWIKPITATRTITDENEALERLDEVMHLAVKRHLVSDVSIASFLSGGVDSSLVTALAAQENPEINTFTIGFSDARYDETEYAALISQRYHLCHHVLYSDSEHFSDKITGWAKVMDDVVADPSALLLNVLSEFARDLGYKVLLSGEGADELFGGYNRHYRFQLARKLVPYGAMLGFLPELLNYFMPHRTRLIEYARHMTVEPFFYGTGRIIEPHLMEKVFVKRLEGVKKAENLSDALLLDEQYRLSDDILTRTDRATMRASIETRVPFITRYVLELANSLDEKLLIRGRNQKYILKRYAERYVPSACLYRRKVGFDLPLGRWFRTSLKGYVVDHLQGTWQKAYFRLGALESIIDDHMNGRSDNADKIFAFVLLEDNVKFLKSIRIQDFIT